MNIFGQGVTGPAGMPLTREMREGGEQQTFRAQEDFIPQAEPAPVQPVTQPNYFTPDEARSRYAQHLPIQATPNDVLLPSDDPRVYTYQMPNGDIYYLPAFEEQLTERRSVGEVIDLAMDSIPSRTEVESAIVGAPRAIYDSINRQITGQGTYQDMLNTAGMIAGAGLARTTPEDSLGMFTGNRGNYNYIQESDRGRAELSADTPREVWSDTRWRLREQGAPFDYTEISDQNSRVSPQIFQEIVDQLSSGKTSAVTARLGDVFNTGFDATLMTDLYSVYPELENVSVRFHPPSGYGGMFNPVTGNISVAIDWGKARDQLSEDVRSVLLHEIQHWVQNREGWQAQGSNPQWLSPNPDSGFWSGIQPKPNRDGSFNHPVDVQVNELISATRSYGSLLWQNEFLKEYLSDPDTVYSSIIRSTGAGNYQRTPIENLVIFDYQNNHPEIPRQSTGYRIFNPGQVEQTIRQLSSTLETKQRELSRISDTLGITQQEFDDFLNLGLVSTSDTHASYFSEAGEVQSRNTENRRNISSDVRSDIFPEDTEYSRQPTWNMLAIEPYRQGAISTIERLKNEW